MSAKLGFSDWLDLYANRVEDFIGGFTKGQLGGSDGDHEQQCAQKIEHAYHYEEWSLTEFGWHYAIDPKRRTMKLPL
ncbi:hypothetical protein PCAR4_810094 [Paraburkholderia caribensis]|nr:hypothetical protein PCAR4_810094 [Paraburkholderia caribensis]